MMGLEEEEAEDQAAEEEDGDAVEGELLAPQAAGLVGGGDEVPVGVGVVEAHPLLAEHPRQHRHRRAAEQAQVVAVPVAAQVPVVVPLVARLRRRRREEMVGGGERRRRPAGDVGGLAGAVAAAVEGDEGGLGDGGLADGALLGALSLEMQPFVDAGPAEEVAAEGDHRLRRVLQADVAVESARRRRLVVLVVAARVQLPRRELLPAEAVLDLCYCCCCFHGMARSLLPEERANQDEMSEGLKSQGTMTIMMEFFVGGGNSESIRSSEDKLPKTRRGTEGHARF